MLRLASQSIAETSWSNAETPVLGDDGSNLPSVIACYLKRKQPEVVDQIAKSLKILVPQVQGIWVDNALREKGKPFGEELKFDTVSKNGLSARFMSEGTLLATALLTLLHGDNPPNLLLMDDIDKGLHPRAIASLVEILKGILEQRPDLQIIATTHSPYLLDHIPIQSVICMHVAEDGYARAKPLSDHPEYDHWKDVMTAGEFWGTMGDEWVTQSEKAITP